jgi:ribosomal protein S18 acetylase RimI-like enzyme
MDSGSTKYANNTAATGQIIAHLEQASELFVPPLRQRVHIADYGKKIAENCVTFEAWEGTYLVGLIAAYFNDTKRITGFITSVSVLKEYVGRGVGHQLLEQCIDYARELEFREIKLEVFNKNNNAILFYQRAGFEEVDTRDDLLIMAKII